MLQCGVGPVLQCSARCSCRQQQTKRPRRIEDDEYDLDDEFIDDEEEDVVEPSDEDGDVEAQFYVYQVRQQPWLGPCCTVPSRLRHRLTAFRAGLVPGRCTLLGRATAGGRAGPPEPHPHPPPTPLAQDKRCCREPCRSSARRHQRQSRPSPASVDAGRSLPPASRLQAPKGRLLLTRHALAVPRLLLYAASRGCRPMQAALGGQLWAFSRRAELAAAWQAPAAKKQRHEKAGKPSAVDKPASGHSEHGPRRQQQPAAAKDQPGTAATAAAAAVAAAQRPPPPAFTLPAGSSIAAMAAAAGTPSMNSSQGLQQVLACQSMPGSGIRQPPRQPNSSPRCPAPVQQLSPCLHAGLQAGRSAAASPLKAASSAAAAPSAAPSPAALQDAPQVRRLPGGAAYCRWPGATGGQSRPS